MPEGVIKYNSLGPVTLKLASMPVNRAHHTTRALTEQEVLRRIISLLDPSKPRGKNYTTFSPEDGDSMFVTTVKTVVVVGAALTIQMATIEVAGALGLRT